MSISFKNKRVELSQKGMKPSYFLKQAFNTSLDLVLPNHCLACEEPLIDTPFLCDFCREQLSLIEGPRCEECGKPVGEFSTREKRCAECKRHPLKFSQASAPLQYSTVTRDLLLKLKFEHRPLIANFFGAFLAQHFASLYWLVKVDVVVPAPMHWFKHLARRFNQAELLANSMASQFGMPVSNALKKTRHTQPQVRLARSERLKNIGDSIQVRKPEDISGKTILLIDDVMTTGTTCSECARVLYEAGAEEVFALTVARALMRNPSAISHPESFVGEDEGHT
jgi:ComF family protein